MYRVRRYSRLLYQYDLSTFNFGIIIMREPENHRWLATVGTRRVYLLAMPPIMINSAPMSNQWFLNYDPPVGTS